VAVAGHARAEVDLAIVAAEAQARDILPRAPAGEGRALETGEPEAEARLVVRADTVKFLAPEKVFFCFNHAKIEHFN